MSLPTVALTFDDGPSRWTTRVLDLLSDAGARATFFVIGVYVRDNGHLLKRMVADGHEIGVHGWNHESILGMPNAQLRGQIMLTRAAIRNACGIEPHRWRSPWGHTTDDARDVIQRAGLRIVGLGVDSYDCERDPNQILQTVLPELREETIVCLHDGIAPNAKNQGGSRDATVRALPRILAACRSVTVSELLA